MLTTALLVLPTTNPDPSPGGPFQLHIALPPKTWPTRATSYIPCMCGMKEDDLVLSWLAGSTDQQAHTRSVGPVNWVGVRTCSWKMKPGLVALRLSFSAQWIKMLLKTVAKEKHIELLARFFPRRHLCSVTSTPTSLLMSVRFSPLKLSPAVRDGLELARG